MVFWLTFGYAAVVTDIAPESAENQCSRAESFDGDQRHFPTRRSGHWIITESPNFEIWSRLSQSATEKIARQCEDHRAAMRDSWLGEVIAADWSPKCCVVVHNNAAEFARHVGSSRKLPVGSTTITRDHGRIVFRRIDLRRDATSWQQNALPHELTHVALADAFPDRDLPGWLNEGLAMTFETAELRQRRLRVLHTNRMQGVLPTIPQVFSAGHLPHSEDADLIYAACLSVVGYLHEQDDAKRLLHFAQAAHHRGYNTALNDVYGITGGVAELERRWLASLNENAGTLHREAMASTSGTTQITIGTTAMPVTARSQIDLVSSFSLPAGSRMWQLTGPSQSR